MTENFSYLSRQLAEHYPCCRAALNNRQWNLLVASCSTLENPGSSTTNWFGVKVPDLVRNKMADAELPPFLTDLAKAERARFEVTLDPAEIPCDVERPTLNPTLVALELDWKISTCLAPEDIRRCSPEKGSELLLVWRTSPSNGSGPKAMAATDNELLAMKMALENIEAGDVARQGNVSPRHVHNILAAAGKQELVILPASRLRRKGTSFPETAPIPNNLRYTSVFTLQWHLTNECELHCKHCYDRTQPSPLTFDQARKVVEDLIHFCRNRRVHGNVCLTGGNPFLYRHFMELYSLIAESELDISILGNPASRTRLERMLALRKPLFFQVSLEGLEAHNDDIRGAGHFQRVMDFLPRLKELGIYSIVMLTLTRANIEQVIPLASLLRGKTDMFTFNRLTQTGEGKHLEPVRPEEYAAFLEEYLTAAESNPVMQFKENLFNLFQYHHAGQTLFGGCTGHGCGAAFDFMAVLPNGEAHACRKFPSPIGNVLEQGVEATYDGDIAERYRQGCDACRGCPLRPACGGCPAVTAGLGLDPFTRIDPYCFKHAKTLCK